MVKKRGRKNHPGTCSCSGSSTSSCRGSSSDASDTYTSSSQPCISSERRSKQRLLESAVAKGNRKQLRRLLRPSRLVDKSSGLKQSKKQWVAAGRVRPSTNHRCKFRYASVKDEDVRIEDGSLLHLAVLNMRFGIAKDLIRAGISTRSKGLVHFISATGPSGNETVCSVKLTAMELARLHVRKYRSKWLKLLSI